MLTLRADPGRVRSCPAVSAYELRIQGDLETVIAAELEGLEGHTAEAIDGLASDVAGRVRSRFLLAPVQPHRFETRDDGHRLSVVCAGCGLLSVDVDSAHCPRFWVGLDTPWMRCGNHDVHLPHRYDGVICPGIDLERLQADAQPATTHTVMNSSGQRVQCGCGLPEDEADGGAFTEVVPQPDAGPERPHVTPDYLPGPADPLGNIRAAVVYSDEFNPRDHWDAEHWKRCGGNVLHVAHPWDVMEFWCDGEAV